MTDSSVLLEKRGQAFWITIRMDRLGDQHAAANAIEQFRGQRSLAAHVAEYHRITIGDRQCGRIVGMDHHRRPTDRTSATR